MQCISTSHFKQTLRLCILVFTATLSFVFTTGCGTDKTPAEQLLQAQTYLDESEYKSAEIILKTLLQEDSSNPQARRLLGSTLFAQGDLLSAKKELRAALDHGGSAEMIQPLIADILLRESAFDDLKQIDHSKLSDAAQGHIMATKALAALYQAEISNSRQLIAGAMDMSPEDPHVRVAHAKFLAYTSGSNLDGARVEAQQVLDTSPDYAPAWNLLGSIEQAQGNYEAAETAFSRALVNSHNPDQDKLQRALVRFRLDHTADAIADLNSLSRHAISSPAAAYIRGLIAYKALDFEQARIAFQISTRSTTPYPAALLFLGKISFSEGHYAQAENFTRKFLAAQPENVEGNKLMARILLQVGDYREAINLLQPVVAFEDNDIEALNLLADALVREGELAQAVDLLTQVSLLEPDSASAKVRLGASLYAQGELDMAAAEVEEALLANPDSREAAIVNILMLLNKKDYESALSFANSLLEKTSDDVAVYSLLGRIYRRMGENDLATQAFKSAWNLSRGDPEIGRNLSELALTKDDFSSAATYQETVLAQHPGNLSSLLLLAGIDAKSGNRAAMIERIEEAKSLHPDALVPSLVLARYHLSIYRPDIARIQLSALNEKQKTLLPTVLTSVQIDLAEKNYRAAEKQLLAVKTRYTGSATIHFLLANAYAGQGKAEQTLTELDMALGTNPDYVAALYAKASILIATKHFTEAEIIVERLVTLAPTYPRVIMMQASIKARDSDPDSASKLAEKAFAAMPEAESAIFLAKIKLSQNDDKAVLTILRQWLEHSPSDEKVVLLYAHVLNSTGSAKDAIRTLTEFTQNYDASYAVFNNLAWIMKDDKPELAVRYAEKALAMSPGNASVLDTLSMAYLAGGHAEKAQSVHNQASRASNEDAAIALHGIKIAFALGETNSARNMLRELLGQDLEQGTREEALALKVKKDID